MTIQNISGFGLQIQVVASTTFPNQGFTITQFADDADPLDIPELRIAESAMGLNGTMIVWQRPEPVEIAINVVPDSPDDQNLAQLFFANRIAEGKRSANDIITMTGVYPAVAPATTGAIITLSEGILVAGNPGTGVQASARKKTKLYRFRFKLVTRTAGQ